MKLELRINGETRTLDIHPGRRLLDLIRDDLGLTGTKEGCGNGECGACTVLLDGQPVNSCLVPAAQCQGSEVITIEGLGGPDALGPMQQAFIDAHAVQCGFCTPGMIMVAKALLDRNPNPSETQIREALAGNLCRCTGYVTIIEAVQLAARRLRGEAP
jgi:aerobic carbon-monoxide dehydrogenase small subunit